MSDLSSMEFTPPTIEEIGELLPAYDVHHFIAKGGMGAVYMARQKSLERDVAIKVLPRHFGADETFRSSFETEAKSMAKLNHPNLVSIYDFGQVDGLLYIIMELVPGKSLYHSSYGKTIDADEAGRITASICDGLASAHKQGILHRDIKPANILLTLDASPKIGDFGLARPVGDTDSEFNYGTPGYTAPEIIHNPSAVDASTDLFAVGVMLYELLTGHLPASNYSPAASEVGCDPEFDRIIRKATHPTPAFRYRKAEDMAKDLNKLLIKKNSPQKKLLEASSTPTASTAKTLLTASSASSSSNKLKTPERPAASPEKPDSPTNVTEAGPDVHLIRNIIIIIALLAAIFVAWEGLKIVKAKHAAKQELADKKRADQEAEREKERQRKIKEAKEARDAKMARDTPLVDRGSTPDELKSKPETPIESLERLRSALYQGARNELPKGTIQSGNRARFYISTPMSWHSAQLFCERHGGHLAVFEDPTSLRTFASKITSPDGVWIGAGTAGDKQWCWIDGTPWVMEIRNTSKPSFVSVNDTGVLRPSPLTAKLPFYIEWMMDGSSPATLKKQLERCAETLSSGSPVYPAGTASYANRRYLLVSFPTDWQTARELAESSGGVLAVPSNADENIWISNYLSSTLIENQYCWFGGIQPAGKAWQWANGEPWQFANWQKGSPDEDTREQLACAINTSGKWEDFTTDSTNSAFLIEWSKDGSGRKVVTSARAEGADPVAPTRKKCAEILRGLEKEYREQLKKNISGYEQELRSYKRRLPKSVQEAVGPVILEMQGSYDNGKIPDDMDKTNMTKKLHEIYQSRLEKQSRHTDEFHRQIDETRKKYRTRLGELSDEFKKKGLNSRVKKIQLELKKTNNKPEKFLDHIRGR